MHGSIQDKIMGDEKIRDIEEGAFFY